MNKRQLERELAEANERIDLLRARVQAFIKTSKLMVPERPEYDKSGRRLAPSIGACPECGGRVYEFEDNFSCIRNIKGECSFTINRSYLEEIMVIDDLVIMEELLEIGEGDYWFEGCLDQSSFHCFTKLRRSDDSRWYVEHRTVEYPA